MSDPEKPIGSKPSGAEFKRRRQEREKAERAAAVAQSGELDDLLERIGAPPTENPETALPWFRKAQLILLWELLKDPSATIREKFAAVKQMSEAAGKTGSRADLEQTAKDVDEALDQLRPAPAVKVRHGIPPAATARGQGGARGPGPVAGPSPRPPGPERDPPGDGGGEVGQDLPPVR